MLEDFEPEMLKLVLESNEKQNDKMKNSKVAAKTKKVTNQASKFEWEQDKQVMC